MSSRNILLFHWLYNTSLVTPHFALSDSCPNCIIPSNCLLCFVLVEDISQRDGSILGIMNFLLSLSARCVGGIPWNVPFLFTLPVHYIGFILFGPFAFALFHWLTRGLFRPRVLSVHNPLQLVTLVQHMSAAAEDRQCMAVRPLVRRRDEMMHLAWYMVFTFFICIFD
jgi:hypothetical protein